MDNDNLTVQALIENLQKIEDNLDDLDVKIVFYKRTRSKKDDKKFKAYSIGVRSAFGTCVKRSIQNAIATCQGKETCEYNLEVSEDDIIQYIDEECVPDGVLINGLLFENDKHEDINKDTDFSQFDFLAVSISDAQKEFDMNDIIIYKKYYHPYTKFKQHFKYRFIGSEIEEIKEEVLSLSSNVETIYVNNKYYVINRISFISIFKFKDFYNKIITDNSAEINNTNLFEDTNQFVGLCRNSDRSMKKLATFIVKGGIERIRDYSASDIETVARNYGEDLTLSETGEKLTFETGREVDVFLKVAMGKFAIDSLTHEKIIAAAIERYGVN